MVQYLFMLYTTTLFIKKFKMIKNDILLPKYLYLKHNFFF